VGEKCSDKFRQEFEFHVILRDLLHAANLRHGTDGFTSPPKEGVLRIFSYCSYRTVNMLRLRYKKNNQLMLHNEITAVCSEIHLKRILGRT
jgi:hypothetical protein